MQHMKTREKNMLKKINCLTRRESDAIYALWEYVANQKDSVVDLYLEDLRIISKIIDIDDEKFIKETGCEPMNLDEYYKTIYGDDE